MSWRLLREQLDFEKAYDVVDYFSNICESNNLQTNFKDNNDNVLLYGVF